MTRSGCQNVKAAPVPGSYRHGFDDRARHRAEPRHPGKNRVLHRGGDVGSCCEHLGDVEGVAPGDHMEVIGIYSSLTGQCPYGVHAERLDIEPFDGASGGQVAEHHPQRVAGVDLIVAVGAHHHRIPLTDAAAEETKQVQGPLIGPVDILDDQHRRLNGALQPPHELGEHLGSVRGQLQQVSHARVGVGCDVENRAQRPRSGEGVAGPDQNPDAGCGTPARLTNQTGLARSRLAGDQGHASLTRGGGGDQTVELRQKMLSLQQARCRCRHEVPESSRRCLARPGPG